MGAPSASARGPFQRLILPSLTVACPAVTDVIDDKSGMELHIDPYGPLNPLHAIVQVFGGWLGAGDATFPNMLCAEASGCVYGSL